MAASTPRKLTPKQERFCREYVIDLNGTQAAIRSGYSENIAKEIAYENLTKPHIQSYVAELKAKSSKKIEVTHEQVLKELRNWAYSDITETIMLSPEEVKELPKEIRRLITKYKHVKRDFKDGNGKVTHTDHTVELWFVSKDKALEMINRHIGFYEVDNKQKQPIIQDMSEDEKQKRIQQLMNKASGLND